MISRRAFLAVAGLTPLAGCASAGRSSADHNDKMRSAKPERSTYGSDPSQFGELYRPKATGHAGTVVIVHGGFWQAQYGLDLGRPLAKDLVARGYTCWNLEYRRIGNGGGWPATFVDVATGIDHLASLDVDTSSVVVIGHSAGGHLAVWAAGRAKLPASAPGGPPAIAVTGVISQAGVLDLAVAADTGVGGQSAAQLVRGTPAGQPERYRLADPIAQVPIDAPVYCLHSPDDQNVPLQQSTAYVAAATTAGGKAALHRTVGDHFTLIDVKSAAWAKARDALPALSAGRLPD
ncbi:MAG: alpha/beta hydrolase [Jatrophihabitans sp.]